MEPKLKIKIADLFEGPNPVDVDFIAPNQQLPGDFIDADSNDAQQNMQVEMDWSCLLYTSDAADE